MPTDRTNAERQQRFRDKRKAMIHHLATVEGFAEAIQQSLNPAHRQQLRERLAEPLRNIAANPLRNTLNIPVEPVKQEAIPGPPAAARAATERKPEPVTAKQSAPKPDEPRSKRPPTKRYLKERDRLLQQIGYFWIDNDQWRDDLTVAVLAEIRMTTEGAPEEGWWRPRRPGENYPLSRRPQVYIMDRSVT